MSTISGKSGEKQRGSKRIERTLEVEEEFDLVKLGFVSQPDVAEAVKEETSSVVASAVQLIDTSSPQVDGDRKSDEVQELMRETEGAKKKPSDGESSAVLSIDASAPVDEDGTGDDALGDEVKGEVSERAKEDSSYSESSTVLPTDRSAPVVEDGKRNDALEGKVKRGRKSNRRKKGYASADWSPSGKGASNEKGENPLPLTTGGESAESEPAIAPVIAHDFAPHPISSPAKVNPTPLPHLEPQDGNESAHSAPSLASGILTSTETTMATPSLGPRKPRDFTARIVTIRRPGRRGARQGVRITRRPIPVDTDVSRAETPPLEPLPRSQFLEDVVEMQGREMYDKLKLASKLHNTSGHLLPPVIRDLLPTLSDRKQGVQLINEVRANFDLPQLSTRMDRVLLQKALAQMRERLYLELASAFILPHAPPELPPPEETVEPEDKVSMSMTPSSFETLSRTLPKVFHMDKAGIQAALASKEGMYGEEGDVVWQGGVGAMKRRLKDGEVGLGYRGGEKEGLVHIFVDHSNILHGLMHYLYSSPLPLPPRHQRILSLPCLSLLLRRGRPTRSSHLVASSPIHQDFDPLVRLHWEVSVLKRVEIYESEVADASSTKLVPKAVPRAVAGALGGGGGAGTRRYKEQGVDEILTLKMLQTINRVEAVKGSTMVLATGDARGGQFNQEGFLGAVREAVGRGWNVELWSFSSGLSRAWRETAKREKWDGRFRIFTMDEWAGELVEVNEDAE